MKRFIYFLFLISQKPILFSVKNTKLKNLSLIQPDSSKTTETLTPGQIRRKTPTLRSPSLIPFASSFACEFEPSERNNTLEIFFNGAMAWVVHFLEKGFFDKVFLQKIIRTTIIIEKLNFNKIDIKIDKILLDTPILDREKFASNFINFIEQFNYQDALNYVEKNIEENIFTKIRNPDIIIDSKMLLNIIFQNIFKHLVISLIQIKPSLKENIKTLLFSSHSMEEKIHASHFIKALITHYIFSKKNEHQIISELANVLENPLLLHEIEELQSNAKIKKHISCKFSSWIKAFEDGK